MDFDIEFTEMINGLDDLQTKIESNSDKSALLSMIKEIDELNKEVALKNECTKIYAKKFETEYETIEEEIQTQHLTQDRLKVLCKELKNEIKEIEGIKNKTEQNHLERMDNINKNYNEVIIQRQLNTKN